ncbi:MAG: response regulator transcription factor [Chloroflexota bacterium]
MGTNAKVRVMVISRQYLFRLGIEHTLVEAGDIEVTTAAEVNETLLSSMDTLPPDIVLVDIDSSEEGLKTARQIRQRLPNIGVVVLTSKPDDSQLLQAIKAQAGACLDKEVTADQLVDTIRRVTRGEHPINESLTSRPALAEQVLHQFQELSWRSEAEALMSPLTPRETEILSHMAQGNPNKQIAIKLGISEQTIKNHVTSIMRKLNANARTEAVVVAIKQGLITLK